MLPASQHVASSPTPPACASLEYRLQPEKKGKQIQRCLLTRPVRRRSHYPSLLAVQNALKKLKNMSDEVQALAAYLDEHLEAIREHAGRERVNRL